MAKKRNVNSSKEELNLLAQDVITSIIQGSAQDFLRGGRAEPILFVVYKM